MESFLWHPLRANPLDYVEDKDLVDRDGNPVEISQNMDGNFVVTRTGYPAITY